ncbi:hypothetical protein [Mycobacterium avium]|uniref:hypothetical protein n=1 Tax=Mycobacterium avium TaxID=1764 RepID=UPI000AA3063D|nr:hypothetical protein [Mycobacterium avium]
MCASCAPARAAAVAGTSNSAWDPVAAACASMNYQMSRYGVSPDGSNQRLLVGQANPGIRQGY